MKTKKSQNAIEFMLVIFMIMVGFSGLVIIMNEKAIDFSNERYSDSLIDVASILEMEIIFAEKSVPGYIRNFTLPEKILNKDYNITFKNGSSLSGNANYSLFIINYTQKIEKTNDYLFFGTRNISGTIEKGNNQIIKYEDYICINC
jgi:hypothetical protein